jgi:hypothetical protein
VKRRKKKRGTLVVGLLAIAAVALTAGLLWRWVVHPAASPDTVHETPALPARAVAPPNDRPTQQSEEFSAAERRRLENILRQKKPEAQR